MHAIQLNSKRVSFHAHPMRFIIAWIHFDAKCKLNASCMFINGLIRLSNRNTRSLYLHHEYHWKLGSIFRFNRMLWDHTSKRFNLIAITKWHMFVIELKCFSFHIWINSVELNAFERKSLNFTSISNLNNDLMLQIVRLTSLVLNWFLRIRLLQYRKWKLKLISILNSCSRKQRFSLYPFKIYKSLKEIRESTENWLKKKLFSQMKFIKSRNYSVKHRMPRSRIGQQRNKITNF